MITDIVYAKNKKADFLSADRNDIETNGSNEISSYCNQYISGHKKWTFLQYNVSMFQKLTMNVACNLHGCSRSSNPSLFEERGLN